LKFAKSLTIIVPIHRISNGADQFSKWIRDPVLDSVQLILIHDSSDGESFSPVIESCDGLDNVIFLEENLNSPGLARNLGLEMANREWVAFWDFDDLPHPSNFLELLHKTISEGNLIGVGCFKTCRKNGDTSRRFEKRFRSESPRDQFDLMVNPGIWRWVFARSLVDNTRFQSAKRGEDQLFLAEINAFDYPITIYENSVYSYFVGDKNSLSARADLDVALLHVARKFLQLSRVCSGKTALFSRVAFLTSCLTFIKRNLIKREIIRVLNLTHWILLMLLFSPKVIPIIMRRHRFYNKSKYQEGKILDVYFAGGLGNQLFQLSFVYNFGEIAELRLHQPSTEILALIDNGLMNGIKLGNPNIRVTKIDHISLLEKFARNQSLRLGSHKYPTGSIMYKLFRRVWINFLSVLLNRKSFLIVPNGLGDDEKLTSAKSRMHISIIGYFQSHSMAGQIREDLNSSLLSVFSRSQDKVKELSMIVKPQSIILHLRLGDYLAKRNSGFGVMTDRYFKSAFEMLGKSAKTNNVVLFSNNTEMAITLLKNLEMQNLTPIPEELSTLETLYLLSLGTNYIISNSTFSWWGAFLSESSDKLVIAPVPWFKNHDENLDLIPLNWARCDSGW
jgi:glycosyltransferase involved in cell wall biosynthesis